MFGSKRREREFLEALDRHDEEVAFQARIREESLRSVVIDDEVITIADTDKIRRALGRRTLG